MRQGDLTWVYMVTNRWHTAIYTGVTSNLRQRALQHKTGSFAGFSKQYNCTELVYFEEYSDIRIAIGREKQLKKYRREKKEELIERFNPEWRDLAAEL
jgi:putative endonuclease